MKESLTQPVHFLLVDDQDKNLVALESLLRREGLSLLKARSGADALELLLKYDVALALVDVQMPNMDGFELAEFMRGTERTRRVPIIFLTAGNADQQRRFRGYEAGAVDFLQKPIEPDVLRSKAEVFFELHRQRQEVARQRDELASMIAENSRLLEDSRQYAQALQEADRRKDEFLATLAHELRNPLAPILNAVQVLRMSGLAGPDAKELQQIIDRQAHHMARLVGDLLDVSRISGGKIQLRRDVVNLADVVHSAIETSRPLIEAAGHELVVEPSGERLEVEGDMVRLTQVLANLLNNAAKYTPEGGRIVVSVASANGRATVRVRDNGLGIPVEMLDKVFDMFTQINRHLKRAQGGLGIGLTLVRKLVEMHGGIVSVSSPGEGHGSEFAVELPLNVPEQPQHALPADSAARRAEAMRRILIIDDNIDALKSLSLLLRACGHEVMTVTNGSDGIEQTRSFQPNVVLLDLGMPDMDGFETARQLRELPEGRDTILIALTGWGQEQDRNRSKAAGFDMHLVKPVELATLNKMLAAGAADL